MEKVSIIIPVYNNAPYIEKCVRSVMAQTYEHLEILVIDDGSTDASYRIVKKLADEDKRIFLIHQENRGVSSARNRGLEFATGKYLTFVDGDDYICDNYIAQMVECAQQYDAEMVICGLTYVDENGTLLRTLIPGEYVRFEREEWTFRISAVCSHLYERQLWEKYDVKFQPEERGEDMPISLLFSAICAKISTLSAAGYFYVQHSASAMHNFRGLKNYRLPCHALETVVKKVETTGLVNNPEFYELFVLRILATCFFDLGRGASRKTILEFCDYMVYLLETYFPKYYKNRKAGLFTDIQVPFFQKVAVWFLVILVRTRLIYPVSALLSKMKNNY